MPDSRPRLVVRLVGIADYTSAGLEGNDNHTSTCTLNIYNECTCTVTNLQSYYQDWYKRQDKQMW